MLFYARADTHFLLFIFHSLLQAIQSSGHGLEGLEQVANESNQVASTFYAHPCHDASTGLGPYGWRGLVQKWNKHLLYHVPAMPHEYITPRKTSLEFHVFRALHDWRDRVARDTDEAPRYVLSHHLLFKLAEERPDSINKLRTILGPAIKGKEQLVGLMRREIEKWEDLPDEPASSDDTHMESQGVLGNGLVREDAPVQQPSHLWSESRPLLHVNQVFGV